MHLLVCILATALLSLGVEADKTLPVPVTISTGPIAVQQNDDQEETEFSEGLNEAVLLYNKEANAQHWYTVVDVAQLDKQVVCGVRYEFNIKMAPTCCSVEEVLQSPDPLTAAQRCEIDEDEHEIVCTTSLWLRSWLSKLEDRVSANFTNCFKVGPKHEQIEHHENEVDLGSITLTETEQLQVEEILSMKLNLHLSRSNVVRIIELIKKTTSETIEKLIDEEEFAIIVDTTKCTGPLTTETYKQIMTQSCYEEVQGNSEKCKLIVKKKGSGYDWTSSVIEECVSDVSDVTTHTDEKYHDNLVWKIADLPIVASLTEEAIKVDTQLFERIKFFRMEALKRLNTVFKSIYFHAGEISSEVHKITDSKVAQLTFDIEVFATKFTKRVMTLKKFLELKEETWFNAAVPHLKRKICTVIVDAFETRPIVIVKGCRSVLPVPGKKPSKPAASKPDSHQHHSSHFADLLKQMEEKVNQLVKSTEHFVAGHVGKPTHYTDDKTSFTMDVTFHPRGCAKKGTCDSDLTIQCKVHVVVQSGKQLLEQIELKNCLSRQADDGQSQVSGQVTTGGPKVSQKLPGLIKRALVELTKMKYSVYKHQDVTEVQVTVGKETVTRFKLHVTESSSSTHKKVCEVLARKAQLGGGEDKVTVFNCQSEPVTVEHNKPGELQPMPDYKIFEKAFLDLIGRVKTKINEVIKSTTYVQPKKVEKPEIKVVSGSVIKFLLHSQLTSCRKGAHDGLFRTGRIELCGPINRTHMKVCEITVNQSTQAGQESIQVGKCRIERIHPSTETGDQTATDTEAADHYHSTLVNTTTTIGDGISSVEGVDKTIDVELIRQRIMQQMVDQASHIYNDMSKYTVYFKTFFTETIKEEVYRDSTSYKYRVTFKPTRCSKSDDELHFLENKLSSCRAEPFAQPMLVTCDVVLKSVPGSDQISINLMGCHKLVDVLRHATSEKIEFTKEKIVEYQKYALSAIDKYMDIQGGHEVYWVENLKQENYVGSTLIFDMHMRPTECTSSPDEDCQQTLKPYSVKCHVKIWLRPWLGNSRTVQVSDCQVVKVKSDEKPVETSLGSQTEVSMQNQALILSKLTDLVKIFNSRIAGGKSEYVVERIMHVTEQVVSGIMIRFEIVFKAKTTKSSTSDLPSYHCLASIWNRPWLASSSVMKLEECRTVEVETPVKQIEQTIENDEQTKRVIIKQFQEQTMHMFGEVRDSEYTYDIASLDKISEVRESVATRAVFKIILKAATCLSNDKCGDISKQPKYQCTLEIVANPLQSFAQEMSLTHCFAISVFSSLKPGTTALTETEQMSIEFQESIKMLAETYQQNTAIVYSVDRIENGQVEAFTGTNRSITLTVVFKPVGCNATKAQNDPKLCRGWKNKSPVQCQAEIYVGTGYPSWRHYRLSDCQVEWTPVDKHHMTKKQLHSRQVIKSLRSALRMYTRKISSKFLLKLRNMQGGTMERGSVETTIVQFQLVQTTCIRSQTKAKWFSAERTACPIADPMSLYNCELTIIRRRDGSEQLSMRCSY